MLNLANYWEIGDFGMTVDGAGLSDWVDLPKPSSWLVNPKPLMSDATRAPGTGIVSMAYITTAYEIVWTYKYLSQDDYDVLYNAYVQSSINNKYPFHIIKSRDSNTDQIIYATIYLQSDFQAPLYRIKHNGDGTTTRYYKDVTFTFVSVGGEDIYNFWGTGTAVEGGESNA